MTKSMSGIRMLWRMLLRGLFVATTATCAAWSGPTFATSYVDTINIAVDSLRCSYLVSTQHCYTGASFGGGGRIVQSGDTFTENISFDAPLIVPGSTGVSIVEALLVDATAYPGGLVPGPYQTLSTLTLSGYTGPALTFSGPQTTSANFGYDAFTGSCCSAPTSAYSITGAQAYYQIQSDGVRPIEGLAFGFITSLAGTPDELAGFQGGNPDAPVLLPSGLVGEITANIGGDYGSTQFYGFNWQGGLFQTEATIFGADPTASFNFKLFDSFGALIDSLSLNQSNNFDGLMTDSLDAGIYKIGLATSDIPDPTFRIQFRTPVGTTGGVPEPSTWAMMLIGFGAMGGAMRFAKRRRTVTVSYA